MTKGQIHDHRTPEERSRPFLPGMGKEWLMPFYDALTRVTGVRQLHERGVAHAGIEAGQDVLDVGCGTGNLALTVLRTEPDAKVTGLDPDAGALRRAARKANRGGVRLELVQGYADRLPAEDASLDHVISSLAVHHLDEADRVTFAREAGRVLRPGGKVTIVDFGGPGTDGDGHGEHSHRASHLTKLFRRRVTQTPMVAPNLENGIVTLLADAGFEDARDVEHIDHRFGPITIVQATS